MSGPKQPRPDTREERSKRITRPIPPGEATSGELVLMSSPETEFDFYVKLVEKVKGDDGPVLMSNRDWTAEIILGVTAHRQSMTREETRAHALAMLQLFAKQFSKAVPGPKGG